MSTASDQTIRKGPLALGLLTLAALLLLLPIAKSGASFTSSSSNPNNSITAAADWTPPMVAVVNPGDAIRGTVTISATASDAEVGIKNVAIAWAPSGTTTFTTLCTDTSSPYSCPFNTVGLPEDYIDIRAIATDNSNLMSTDVLEGVLVDNVAPTGSLDPIASPISGVITLTASTADDAGSGVASVVFQRATAGTTTFTTICTDIDLPWNCSFDSTTVADGLYDFRGIVTDVAGNTFTTATVRNRIVSNVVSSVSVNDPGAFLRGTVTITANANAATGVANVKIQRQTAGSTTWVDLCTDTTAPYSCPFNTTLVADGNVTFRAILTDSLGQVTTSAVVGPSRVDNTPVRGYDVQTTTGGTAGKLTTGDVLTLTYAQSMKLSSILAGWTGAATTVELRLRDGKALGLGGSDDTVDVFTTTSLNTAVNLGSMNLKGNYVKSGKTVGFAATMTQQPATVNGQSATAVALQIGPINSGLATSLRTVSGLVNMIWTPSGLAQDVNGVPTSTAGVTELGAADRDF